MQPESLERVRETLLAELGGNAVSLSCICTRMVLRCGINLNAIVAAQNRDPQAVAKAVRVLRELGFKI